MKINWGTGIFIAFVLFMAFILFFVIKASTQKEYAYDLVDEEYYKSELKYQGEIDKQNNLKELNEKISFITSNKNIEILFPSNFNGMNTKGTLFFIRPSSKNLDFSIPMNINDGKIIISNSNLVQGNWNIKIAFESEGKEYLYKNSFTH